MNNFHQLEVVGRGSETQLQAGEKNCIQLSATMVNLLVGLITWKKNTVLHVSKQL